MHFTLEIVGDSDTGILTITSTDNEDGEVLKEKHLREDMDGGESTDEIVRDIVYAFLENRVDLEY